MNTAPGGNSRTGRSAPPSVEDVAGRAAGCDSGERNMAAERGGRGRTSGPWRATPSGLACARRGSGEERGGEAEKIFEETMAGEFQNLMKHSNPSIQESLRPTKNKHEVNPTLMHHSQVSEN